MMKLLTLNCHGWLEQNVEEKLQVIANTIYDNRYDVVALQEVNQRRDSRLSGPEIREDNYALAIVERLRRLGDLQYQLSWSQSHIGYELYEEGVALLTRRPICERRDFFVSRSERLDFWKTRKVLAVTLEYGGRKIDVYSCHLGWWEDEEEPFAAQVDRLRAQLRPDRLALLLGDFNSDAAANADGYRYLLQGGLVDTFVGAASADDGITVRGKIDGWRDNRCGLRLDLILTNRSVAVQSSRVVFNGQNQTVVSDHYGVEVELRLPRLGSAADPPSPGVAIC